MSKQYNLSALDNFTCIGGDCPDNCCKRHWDIQVDKDTYNKWQLLNDDNNYKNRLIDSIKITKKLGQEIYLFQRKEGSTSCVHLDEQSFCSVQNDLGADMLPSVCRVYPRRQYKIMKINVRTAEMSCPEITRLVLFSHDEPVYRKKGKNSYPLGKEITLEKVFWHLEKLANLLLADKNFPLNIKLTYLARVLAEISTLISNHSLDEKTLKYFSSEYQINMKDMRNAIANKEFGTNPVTAKHMWHLILNALAQMTDLNKKLGLSESIAKLLKVYDSSTDNTDNEDIFNKNIQIYKRQAQSKMKCYNGAFDRYIQAVFVLKGFPWTTGEHGYIDAFLQCTIPLAMIQLLSWLYIEEHKEISNEELITIIYSIEKRFGHNSEINDTIKKSPDLRKIELYFDWFLDVI